MKGIGHAERERLGELLERALALPPGQCPAFLEDACGGNMALHEELVSLLASHAEAPDFLERIENALLPVATDALTDAVLPAGTIIGRYEIIESLGSGGMGVVYKARDPTLDRLVALKFLSSHLSSDAEARARLKREARAASSLDHPNIAVVYEIGEMESAPGRPESGGFFIAMAYYQGETVKARIARGGLSIREALDYAVQLADALSRAHGAGIVHRDIKPANVMVTESAQIKIVDFGVAKSAHSTGTDEVLKPEAVEARGDLTRADTRLGTVAYMSPEQTRGGAVVDHRTDLWSLGVVLYEMLAGVRPFRGEAEDAIIDAIRNEEPTPLETLRPDTPPGLARVVNRCLAKDPAARYASAAALLTDLRSLAAIPDARAYESYLRARYEAWRFSRDRLDRAKRYIDTAIDIVGDNELLYSTLGHIMMMYVESGIEPGAATAEHVDALADRVFALNPESARGHWLKSWVAYQRCDLRAALRAGERALALEPDELDTILFLAYLYAHAGRNGDARALIERSVMLDPLMPLTHSTLGYVAIMEGRFNEAVEAYRRSHAMDPDGPLASVSLGWALAFDRQFDEATAVLDGAADRFPAMAFASWSRSLAHGLRGESADAVRAITPVFEAAARSCETFTSAIANCFALAGETELALDWLEHDVRRGMLNYTFLAEYNWFLDSVRSEPRFKTLMERVRAASIELGDS